MATAQAAAELLRTDGADAVDRLAARRRYATNALGRLMGARLAFSVVAEQILGECADVRALRDAAEMWNNACLDFDEAHRLAEIDALKLVDICRVATNAVIQAELGERTRIDAARPAYERETLARLAESSASTPGPVVGGA